MIVPFVILNYQDGMTTALLAPKDRIEIGVIDVTTPHILFLHTSDSPPKSVSYVASLFVLDTPTDVRIRTGSHQMADCESAPRESNSSGVLPKLPSPS